MVSLFIVYISFIFQGWPFWSDINTSIMCESSCFQKQILLEMVCFIFSVIQGCSYAETVIYWGNK